MCGRYSLILGQAEIEERFDATFTEPFQPRYNAAPSQSLPVITDANPAQVDSLEWGFVPPWAEDRSEFGYINARGETLTEKPTFRDAVEARERDSLRTGRCLVLADGFYEWVEDGGKQPYRVTLADGRPFALAGLWAQWRPPSTQTGLDSFGAGGTADGPEILETFAIVTTEPNDLVADLHHRMAAIVPADREREWLTADTPDALDLLGPYPGEMRADPVSQAVNDPSNDSPAVLEPAEGS
jgi:putative SOS response-associated peptidase YedK